MTIFFTDTSAGPAYRNIGSLSGVDLSEVGALIRAGREAQGLSRAYMSEQTGLATSTIQEIEAGEGNPGFRNVLALAELSLVTITAIKKADELTPPVHVAGDNPSTPGSAANVTSQQLESLEVLVEAAVAKVLQRVGYAITGAGVAGERDDALRSSNEGPAKRRSAHPVARRSSAENVRRLKKR